MFIPYSCLPPSLSVLLAKKDLKTVIIYFFIVSLSKKLYEDMKNRIESAMKLGQISEEVRKQDKGFEEWDLVSDPRNHQAIVQVLLTVFHVSHKDIFTSDNLST